jgi:dephospho-CoA kinase
VRDYLSLPAKVAVETYQNGQIVLGLTGPMCAGKSFIANQVLPVCYSRTFNAEEVIGVPSEVRNLDFEHIDVDQIVRELTSHQKYDHDLAVCGMREQYSKLLGINLWNDVDGVRVVNNDGIADKIFGDEDLNREAREMFRPHILRVIREKMSTTDRGLIVIDAALLIDMDMTYLCNNNVIMVHAPSEDLNSRALARYRDQEMCNLRASSQLSFAEKHDRLRKAIYCAGYGKIAIIDNGDGNNLMNASASVKDRVAFVRRQVDPVMSEIASI